MNSCVSCVSIIFGSVWLSRLMAVLIRRCSSALLFFITSNCACISVICCDCTSSSCMILFSLPFSSFSCLVESTVTMVAGAAATGEAVAAGADAFISFGALTDGTSVGTVVGQKFDAAGASFCSTCSICRDAFFADGLSQSTLAEIVMPDILSANSSFEEASEMDSCSADTATVAFSSDSSTLASVGIPKPFFPFVVKGGTITFGATAASSSSSPSSSSGSSVMLAIRSEPATEATLVLPPPSSSSSRSSSLLSLETLPFALAVLVTDELFFRAPIAIALVFFVAALLAGVLNESGVIRFTLVLLVLAGVVGVLVEPSTTGATVGQIEPNASFSFSAASAISSRASSSSSSLSVPLLWLLPVLASPATGCPFAPASTSTSSSSDGGCDTLLSVVSFEDETADEEEDETFDEFPWLSGASSARWSASSVSSTSASGSSISGSASYISVQSCRLFGCTSNMRITTQRDPPAN
uniref:Uncharacterized protein n=1 Tax=Anopheles farauti TaxID=69004 RepID=A0A182QDH5_9DIPT